MKNCTVEVFVDPGSILRSPQNIYVSARTPTPTHSHTLHHVAYVHAHTVHTRVRTNEYVLIRDDKLHDDGE